MAYAELGEIKETLGLDDNNRDATLTRLLNVATAMIDRYCHRTFGDPLTATPVERVYNAPVGYDLYVDEFTEVMSVVLVMGTSTISLSAADYQLLPRNIEPHVQPSYTVLRRVSNGIPYSWWGDDEGANGVTVRVTAKWLFDAARVPYDVQQACHIMTCRLYHRETAQYANLSGVDANGMQVARMPLATVDPDVRALLDSYRKVRIA